MPYCRPTSNFRVILLPWGGGARATKKTLNTPLTGSRAALRRNLAVQRSRGAARRPDPNRTPFTRLSAPCPRGRSSTGAERSRVCPPWLVPPSSCILFLLREVGPVTLADTYSAERGRGTSNADGIDRGST